MNNETKQIFIVNTCNTQSLIGVPKIVEALVSTDVEDFSTVCRICATVTEFVIPIFDGEGLQNNLAEKIHKHLPIQVSEQDVLPRVVCYQCSSTLLAWHELVQCCLQADDALRARLAARAVPAETRHCDTTESKTIDKNTIEISAHNQPQKSEAPAAPAGRACAYCAARVPPPAYEEHLVALHPDRLFHCIECDAYVDRKVFILHMSTHAAEYAAKPEKGDPGGRAKIPPTEADRRGENENDEGNDRAEVVAREGAARVRGNVEAAAAPPHEEEDEFSDHSDAENGFGPLPESVFEAIEDSQDGRPPDSVAPAGGDRPTRGRGREAGDAAKPGPVKKCPKCGREFAARSSYFYHMKNFHGKSREHECAACGKRFGTKATLAEHAHVHSGARPYACERCGKRFGSRACLYIHAQTHGAAKRWACAQCPRAFRWRAQLARHAQRHAARREHACAQCARRFNIRADLLRHALTHEKQDHVCPRCGLHFAQLRYLKVHTRNKHADAEDATGMDKQTSSPAV